MTAIGAFHHLGVACRNLERERSAYAQLGYEPEGDEFDDPGHGIRGVFLTGPGPRLELVVARPGSAVLEPWLSSGSTVYHLAYETDDLTGAVDAQRHAGAKLVVAPRPAVAFGGRSVAFVMLRTRMLVELISRA